MDNDTALALVGLILGLPLAAVCVAGVAGIAWLLFAIIEGRVRP